MEEIAQEEVAWDSRAVACLATFVFSATSTTVF